MAKFEKRAIALKYRRQGHSLKEIASKLEVSKSTISLWCRNIILTNYQAERLVRNSIAAGHKGRILGAVLNKHKKEENVKFHLEKAARQISSLTKRDMLIAGAALYWAEGAKTNSTFGFSFMNSDPRMILFMKNFLISVMGINEENISCTIQINRVHEPRIGKVLKFWSSLLKLPSKQFRKPYYVNVKHQKVYENHDVYYGTLRLKVEKSSNLKYHILGLIEALNVGVAQVVRA